MRKIWDRRMDIIIWFFVLFVFFEMGLQLGLKKGRWLEREQDCASAIDAEYYRRAYNEVVADTGKYVDLLTGQVVEAKR